MTRSMNKESREENVEESTFDNHDQGHEITDRAAKSYESSVAYYE